MADLRALFAFALMVACNDAARVPRLGEIIKHHPSQVTVLFDDNVVKSQYPEDVAEKLFSELTRRNWTKYFAITEAGISQYNPVKFNYTNLCKSKRHSKAYPLRVRDDKTQKTYWMLNPKSSHFQYFDYELCSKGDVPVETSFGGGKCLVEEIGQGYTTTCEQEYLIRTILFMDNGAIVKAKGRIPSCCSCYVKATDMFLDGSEK